MDPQINKKINSRIRMNYVIIGILSFIYILIILSLFFTDEINKLSYISMGLAAVGLIQAAGSVIDSLKVNNENMQNNKLVLEHLNVQKIILDRLENEVKSLTDQTKCNLENLKSSIDSTKILITDSLNSENFKREKASSFFTVNFHSNKDPE